MQVSEQIEEKREALLDESVILAQDALILALSGSSPPRHGHYSSLAFQPIDDGQLTGPGGGHCSDCGAFSARVASARVARTSEARSAVDRAKPQERVQVLEHHHSSNCSDDENTSGSKKFNRAQSSCRLFWRGVPVNSNLYWVSNIRTV